MQSPNRKPDDGVDIKDPDEDLFKVDPTSEIEGEEEQDKEDETRTFEELHEPRPETTPPVTGANMPM